MAASVRSSSYRFGIFDLRPNERRLLKNGEPVELGARAFDVLVALVERAGRLVPKEELLACVWPNVVVEENNLQVQVSALRKALGQGAIATIPGHGYRFALAPAVGAVADRTATPLTPFDKSVPSIAVLPFENMSEEAANEYFADGITEELINVLSKVRGLRVTSHASAFSFKGSRIDIPSVAGKLNVATILEGSVRKAGKRVRITAQLVEVATDSHLWSDTYDRDLEDIFAVQDDIAQAVVTQLRWALLGEKRGSSASAFVKAEVRDAARGQSANAEAYRLYLQGRSLVSRRTQAGVAAAIEYFRQAVDLDPKYALAWAAMARAMAIEAGIGWARYEEGFDHAREAANRALSLEPDLAEGHAALGLIRSGYDWDWSGADQSMQRALDLAPGNAEVLLAAAEVASTLDHLDEAVTLCQRAIAVDPLNVQAHRNLGKFRVFAGLLDQAEVALAKALDLNPLGGMIYSSLGRIYLDQGRLAEALLAFEKESHDGFRLLGLSMAYHALGRLAPSSAALEQLGELPVHAFLNAQANAYCGNVDQAFEWLERAYAQHNPGLSQLKLQPALRSLYGDSRWPAFVKKVGLAV